MKLMLILFAVVSVATACTSKRRQEEFEAYRRTYRKVYKDETEYNYRCGVFNDNMDIIENHNFRYARSMETYSLGVNQFTDYTQKEFIDTFTGLRPELDQRSRMEKAAANVYEYNPNFKAPASVDWTAAGFDTPIKNQANCGSCYAFATAGVIESAYLIKNNRSRQWEDVSEQHFVDCSTAYGNKQCQGGLMTNTYNYMIKAKHGIQKEADYIYKSADGSENYACAYDSNKSPFTIRGFVEVDKSDQALEQAVAIGPVAVGVNADTWQSYKGGLFCDGTPVLGSACFSGIPLGSLTIGLNHAVIVVGYTKDYWIIKNSWGESWGDKGYMRLCRTYKNNCGINRMASYPLI